jgi:hypothetical protein
MHSVCITLHVLPILDVSLLEMIILTVFQVLLLGLSEEAADWHQTTFHFPTLKVQRAC